MNTSEPELKEATAQRVSVSEDALSVDLVDGRTIIVPLIWFPRLAHGTSDERANWRFIGGGVGIHWADLDEDISVESLVAGRRSGESQESLRQWLEGRAGKEAKVEASDDADDVGVANPAELPMLELVRDIGRYATALLGVSNSNGERLHFRGSGTLVSVDGSHYILTAAHVWAALKQFDALGLTLRPQEEHRFLIERNLLVATVLEPARSDAWGEWGPDLCFLRLPPSHAARIEAAQGVFYNLNKRKDAAFRGTVDLDAGPWILLGVPEASASLTPIHGSLEMTGYYSKVYQTTTKDDFDYLDVGVDLTLPDVPQTFGGVSGGGLWQVLIKRDRITGKFCWEPSDLNLEGVAFYESAIEGARRIIRCHGRRTIYKKALRCLG